MSTAHIAPWRLARSWLYVPGHRPDRVEKALRTGADAVVIDLEDSVPPDSKDVARVNAAAAVRHWSGDGGVPRIWVRVNDPATEWFADDVAALVATDLCGSDDAGVRVPKSEDPELIHRLAESSGLQLHLLIESAAGLMRAHELAACHPRVTSVALGEADLAADLRVHRSGLDWSRGWLVAAARAAGLTSPVQSVYTDVGDVDGLWSDTRRAREQGFFGRSVIHPRQVDPVNAIFSPSADEVRDARSVIDAAERAAAAGTAALLDADGRFIDHAVVRQARVVLDQVRFSDVKDAAPEHPPRSHQSLPHLQGESS